MKLACVLIALVPVAISGCATKKITPNPVDVVLTPKTDAQ